MFATPVRRALVVLLGLTLLVLAVDLARPSLLDPVRRAAALALGPVEQAVAGGHGSRIDQLERSRDTLAARLAQSRADLGQARAAAALLGSDAVAGRRFVAAQVVAFSPASAPGGTRRVSIDAGSADGLRPDLSVVDADGLVGRVVAVYSTSAQVEVLGDPGVQPAVRIGTAAVLGYLSAPGRPGSRPRPYGQLGLTTVGTTSPPHVGDVVRTLGSANGQPYAAGVPVGVVAEVDPTAGRLGASGSVRPYVRLDRLDVVGVLLPTGRVAHPSAAGKGG